MQWNPGSLVSVTKEMVDHYFSPFENADDELQLPGVDRLLRATNIVYPKL